MHDVDWAQNTRQACAHRAASGAEALAMMRDEMPDIVMLDWMSPGLGKFEALIENRREHCASFLPISLPILRARISAQQTRCERMNMLNNEHHEAKPRLALLLGRLMEARSAN